MKKFICLLLLLTAFCHSLKSQSIVDYFKDNVLDLDPIEGIYQVDFYSQGYNAFRIFPEELVNSASDLIIKRGGTNKFKFGENPNIYFERIGESNIYYFWFYWKAAGWTRYKVTLQNSGQTQILNILFEIPKKQLKSDFGRDYMEGEGVIFRYSCVKIIPTQAMYITALEQQRQKEIEASKPTNWSGTGFALNSGYLVTNYHVIEDANNIAIQGVNGDFNISYSAQVVAIDKTNDLALLRITDNRFYGFGTIPYAIKTSTAEVGEDVFVLGYPLTSPMGDEIKLTTGVISSKTGYQGDVSLYQISAPVQPGNSGGPLFDNKGNLIGIVNSKHLDAENVGYAIKSSCLINLIESAATSTINPTNNIISNRTLIEKVKCLKDFVFMVECSNSTCTNHKTKETNVSETTVSYPSVNKTTAKHTVIKSITLSKDNTIIEITSNNQSGNGYYQWCNIDKNAYILVDGIHYIMTKTEGIKIAPEKTYFNYAGQEITFKLFFPPIPNTTISIDLIESENSKWKWHGIKLK